MDSERPRTMQKTLETTGHSKCERAGMIGILCIGGAVWLVASTLFVGGLALAAKKEMPQE